MTQRKQQLISDTKSAVDHLIDSIKENKKIKLVCQIDLAHLVYEKLQESGQGENMDKVKRQVNAVLSKHFTKLQKQIKIDDSRPPLWIIHKEGKLTFPKYKPRNLVNIVETSRQELYLMELKQQLSDMKENGSHYSDGLYDEMDEMKAKILDFEAPKLSLIRKVVKNTY